METPVKAALAHAFRCVRTIVVWKPGKYEAGLNAKFKLRENHSGMETELNLCLSFALQLVA